MFHDNDCPSVDERWLRPGRLNKRRQVRRREPKVATQQEGTVDDSPEAATTDLTHFKSSTTTTTRSGCHG